MELKFVSKVSTAPEELWPRINSFEKLNSELSPFLRMSCPEKYRLVPFDVFPSGRPLFKSIIYLFRFIPVEVSNIRFAAIYPGKGFSEDSVMILSSSWKHKRYITPFEEGAIIADELDITPRFSVFETAIRLFTRITFKIRHRNLRILFG